MAEDVKDEVITFAKQKKIDFESLTKSIVLEESIYRETIWRLDSVPDEPGMDENIMKYFNFFYFLVEVLGNSGRLSDKGLLGNQDPLIINYF